LFFCADANIASLIEVVNEEVLMLALAWVFIIFLFLGRCCSLGGTLVVTSESWVLRTGYLFALRNETT
jgi:hypothetical protein